MPTGFRILSRTRAVAPGIVERFRALPVANVSDSMARLTARGPRLRPMHDLGRTATMAGVAPTVKAPPGDNLTVYKVIALAQPGDVIVVDAGGDLTNVTLAAATVKLEAEQRQMGNIATGTHDAGWVAKQLRRLNCEGL